MKLLKIVADKIGFTIREVKVVIFFLALASIGGIYKIADSKYHIRDNFSYSREDSLYISVMNSARERQGNRLNVDNLINSSRQDTLLLNNSDTVTANRINSTSAPIEKLAKGSIGLVNINTATVAELTTLQGIGIATAEAIIVYRQSIRLFAKISQLKDVKGIGEKKFETIKNHISIK